MLQLSPAAAASHTAAHKHARRHARKNTTCGEKNKHMKPEHEVSGEAASFFFFFFTF